jgi:uncharacterized SAM-binding protein YcdF (DUF218 family)
MDAGLVVVLLAIGLSQGWFRPRFRKWAKACGWAGLILFVILASPLTSNAIRAPLLDAAANLVAQGNGCEGHPGPVVVLGGGATPDGIPGEASLERLIAAARWLKKNPPPESRAITVVVTGGPANLNVPGSLAESDAMAAMLEKLVPDRVTDGKGARNGVQIVKESASLNTHDNALFTRKLLGDKGGPVVLVTSQIHMPRSAAVFAKTGFEVCAVHAPEIRTPPGIVTESGWLNFGTARKSMTTLNEYAGMLAYRLKGWL